MDEKFWLDKAKRQVLKAQDYYERENELHKFNFLVCGGYPYSVTNLDGEFLFYYAVEAFNILNAENPNMELPKRLCEALDYDIQHSISVITLSNIYYVIQTQLEKQIDGTASFTIDCKKYFNDIKNKIEELKLSSDYDTSIDSWYSGADSYVQEHYGSHLK